MTGIQVAQGVFDVNAATGLQSITGVGFKPTAVLLMGNTKTNETSSTRARYLYGAGTSSSEMWYVYGDNSNGVGTSDVYGEWGTDRIGFASNTSGSPNWEIALDSMDSDGFTIDVIDGAAFGAYVSYLAIGGDARVKVGNFAVQTATASQSVTGVGFNPTGLLLFSNCQTEGAGVGAKNWQMMTGMSDGTNECYQVQMSNEGVGTSEAHRYINNDRIMVALDHGSNPTTIDGESTLASFDSDGFTLSHPNQYSNAINVMYVAIGSAAVGVGQLNTLAGTGTISATGLKLLPKAVYMFSANTGTLSGNEIQHVNTSLGWGVSASSRYTFQLHDEDGQGTIDNRRIQDFSLIYFNRDVADNIKGQADLVSFEAGGFTLNQTNADDAPVTLCFFTIGDISQTYITYSSTDERLENYTQSQLTQHATYDKVTFPVDVEGSLEIKAIGNVNTESTYQIDGNTVLDISATDNIMCGTTLDAGTGARNYLFGDTLGKSDSTGGENVYIGSNIATAATTSYENFFGGTESGMSITSGGQNVGIGYRNLYLLTESVQNVGIGRENLRDITTGSNTNVAIGYRNMYLSVGGVVDDNIAIGNQNLIVCEGNNNIAIGQLCMTSLTGGRRNIALGTSTLISNLTGQYMLAVGYGAFPNALGDNCSALGAFAGQLLKTGDNVTLVGYAAGQGESLFDASDFIVIGDRIASANWDPESYRIYIDSNATNPATLIYGETDNELIRIHGDLDVADYADVGSESLDETDFATHAKWDTTGDFDDTGGNATYIHSGGAGTLTQTSANMLIAGVASELYAFTYTISGYTNADQASLPSHTITTAFAASATKIPLSNGTHTVVFRAAAAPGDFVISVTSNNTCDFTMDDVSLKRINGGDLNVYGHVGVGTVPTAAVNIKADMVTSDTTQNIIGIESNLAMDTASAFQHLATQFNFDLDHAAGATALAAGFFGGGNINGAGNVTTVGGVVGQLIWLDTAGTSTATNALSLWGIMDVEDGTATNAVTVYAPEPVVDTGTITNNFAGLFGGDVAIYTNKKLYLEASAFTAGDTYLTFNAGVLDIYVDAANITRQTSAIFQVGATGAGTKTFSVNTGTPLISHYANTSLLLDGVVLNFGVDSEINLTHQHNVGLLYNASAKFLFRDTAIGIYSQADTFLDVFADGAVRIGDSSAGAPTNYVEIESDGDVNFVAGAGLQFGEIWYHGAGDDLALAAQDTY